MLNAVLADIAFRAYRVSARGFATAGFLLALQLLTLVDFPHRLLPDVFTMSLVSAGLLLDAAQVCGIDARQPMAGAVAGYLSMANPDRVYLAATGKHVLGRVTPC